MEAILREELGLSFPLSVVIDPASIEVRGKIQDQPILY